MSASANLCARRKYMRWFMRPRIKACKASITPMLSGSSVVKNDSCGLVSIRGSREK